MGDMKGSRKRRITAGLILAVILGVLVYVFDSDRPLETMTMDEIEEIQGYAIHPDREVTLNETDMERAVPLLQARKGSKAGYVLFSSMGRGG